MLEMNNILLKHLQLDDVLHTAQSTLRNDAKVANARFPLTKTLPLYKTFFYAGVSRVFLVGLRVCAPSRGEATSF